MSQTHNPSMSSTVSTSTGRRTGLLPWAAAGVAGAAVVVLCGNVDVDHAAGEQGGLSDALVTGALSLVVAAIVFGLVLPRVQGPRTAVVLAVLAVLTLAVFWTGVPPVLGMAAVAAGRRPSGRLGVAAWVGAAATAVTVVWSVVALFL